jgi:uncharacterized protein YggE
MDGFDMLEHIQVMLTDAQHIGKLLDELVEEGGSTVDGEWSGLRNEVATIEQTLRDVLTRIESAIRKLI